MKIIKHVQRNAPNNKKKLNVDLGFRKAPN
jgi:hypothetical protein